MSRVKGTILIDFVKTIKADQTGVYDAYLADEDRELINSRILPSAWYPYDFFINCFTAVAQQLAKGDMKVVHEWGRIYGEAIITGVYRGMVKEGAPMDSLKKYGTHIRNLFDFGEIEVKPLTDSSAEIMIRGFKPDFEPQYHMMAGWVERSLELCGAKDINFTLKQKTWEGDPQTSAEISWK